MASAAAVALGVAFEDSDAVAAWTAPVDLGISSATASAPQVGVDALGGTTVVWTTTAGGLDTIRSSFRPAGGAWEDPFTRMSSGLDCHAPDLAVDAAGAAVLVADCGSGPSATVRAAYRAAGGSWAGSIALAGSTGGAGSSVAIDDAGNAAAAWRAADGSLQTAYRTPTVSWATPDQAAPATVADPDMTMSRSGRQSVIWRQDEGGGAFSVQATTRTAGGAWQTPSVLSGTGAEAGDAPRVRWSGTPPHEQRIAVWANYATAPSHLESRWNPDPFGGWFGGAIGFDASADNSVEDPDVGTDSTGRNLAVWTTYNNPPGLFRLQWAATTFINTAWSAPVTLPGESVHLDYEPKVAVAPGGDGTLLFQRMTGALAAARRPAGQTFGAAATLSAPGLTVGDEQLTTDAAGDALAVWAATDRVQLAVDDVTAPVLATVAVPPAAVAGAPVALAAAATDRWSGPVTLSWDFGDGSAPVAGADVTRAFPAGTARITLRATDGVGNVATAERRIEVAAPAPAGAGSGGGGTPSDGGVAPAPGGGGAAPAPSVRPKALTLGVTVPKQSWKAIKKAKAVGLRCSLDTPGTCRATATVTRAVAQRLHLKLDARAKTLTIATATIMVAKAGKAYNLKLKLTAKTRSAIAKATRDVSLALVVSATATGRTSATLTKRLTIRR